MNSTFDFDPNALGAVVSSQPLYQVGSENDIEREFIYYRQSSEHSVDDATSDRESAISCDLRSIRGRGFQSCCTDILASGKLFRLVTKATGLFNPRKKSYAFLCAFFVILNILSLLAEIIIPSICGPFVDRCVTKSVTNKTSQSTVGPMASEVYEITLSFDAWNAFSDTMTFALLIYTLRRADEHLPAFSFASAEAKVSSCEWLLINAMLITCSLAITVASAFRIYVVQDEKMKFYGSFGLGVIIVYLTAFICCCVFAVVSCALCRLVDTCFQEICTMGEGTLNDIIATHQKLYKQLLSACRLFRSWFLVHWLMFGANCLAVFAFDSMHILLLSQQFSGAPTAFMAVAFVLNFAIFLVPCVYASRVTWKCDDLLFKVNNMSSEEWIEGHPFRERAAVNEFIFYAERSKCGFRIGKITFGSSGTWISVLLGLLGLGARLLTYIK